jgi:hypothetical protein
MRENTSKGFLYKEYCDMKAIQSIEVKRVCFSSFQSSEAQGFVGMWESFFLAFPSIVCKVWENSGAFSEFFHAFPQYVISIKHITLPTDSFIDPKFFYVILDGIIKKFLIYISVFLKMVLIRGWIK